MIVKDIKKGKFAYVALSTIIVVCSVYLLSMDKGKDTLRNYYYSLYDSAMTLDLGFSSLRNISLDKANRTLWGSGLGFLAKM